MKHFTLATVSALSMMAGATLYVNGAQAAPTLNGLSGAPLVNNVEDVQYRYHGRRYCWYFDGWQGPGWYWCGYAMRRGLGWGGGDGWRSWSAPSDRGGSVARPRREQRPGPGNPPPGAPTAGGMRQNGAQGGVRPAPTPGGPQPGSVPRAGARSGAGPGPGAAAPGGGGERPDAGGPGGGHPEGGGQGGHPEGGGPGRN